MDTYLKKRLDTSEENFWYPFPNLKIKTFSATTKKTYINTASDIFFTVSTDRYLFGWLLIVSNTRKVNVKEVPSYELLTVPFRHKHVSTTKSVLAKLLEEQVEVYPRLLSSSLETISIIVGMAMVQMLKSAGASTFGKLATKYFTSITAPLSQSNCNEVCIIFDQHWETSIKGWKRQRRGKNSSLEVYIHGPSTPIPKQWGKYIANPQNKVNLCDFLTSSFCNIGKERLAVNKKTCHWVRVQG